MNPKDPCWVAICTKFVAPTTNQGARIKVWAEGNKPKYYPFEYAGNSHAIAAQQYAQEKGWTGSWFGGGLPDKTGYAFIRVFPGMACGMFWENRAFEVV